jgi:hypothetical protein
MIRLHCDLDVGEFMEAWDIRRLMKLRRVSSWTMWFLASRVRS